MVVHVCNKVILSVWQVQGQARLSETCLKQKGGWGGGEGRGGEEGGGEGGGREGKTESPGPWVSAVLCGARSP